MISEALQHCKGIGPARLAKLHAAGVRTWSDVLEDPSRIPAGCRAELTDESRRCINALQTNDIRYLLDRFVPQDKWRVLHHFLDRTTYFDIETDGLECDSATTVIVCWHRGELHTFVEHENLDEFLNLLDDVSLLASFNGCSFDVPRVLDTFHIPALPCPHLDLRWCCYHQGFSGGLKEISGRMGISRPDDLQHADGELAIELWHSWRTRNDRDARQQLIRYCAADVLLLVFLANRLTKIDDPLLGELWTRLPAEAESQVADSSIRRPSFSAAFGTAAPSRLRARIIGESTPARRSCAAAAGGPRH